MIVQVLGKQSFRSEKKNTDYYILHTAFKKDQVSGLAVKEQFVNSELFNKVSVDKCYQLVYGAYDNGRAYISDLIEVQRN